MEKGQQTKVLVAIAVIITVAIAIFYVNHKADEAREAMKPSSVLKRALSKYHTSDGMSRKELGIKRRVETKRRAEELCAKFPDEVVCKLWKEGEECYESDKCMDNLDYEEEFPSASEVLECFAHVEDEVDEDDIEHLPHYCTTYNLIPIHKLGKKPTKLLNEVADLDPAMDKWAGKIKSGHIAGIAKAIELIFRKNEKELGGDASEVILIAEMMSRFEGDDKSSFDQGAGITIGLYNTALAMFKEYEPQIQDSVRQECAALKTRGADIVPIRCNFLQQVQN